MVLLDKEIHLIMKRWLSGFWKKWITFATVIGNFQMIFILTVVYWVLLPITALPVKIFSDPLTLKRKRDHKWFKREDEINWHHQGYEGKS